MARQELCELRLRWCLPTAHRLVVSARLGSSEVMHAGSVAESLLLRIGFAPPVVVLFMPSRKQVDSRTGLRWIRAGIDRFLDG